MEKLEVYEYGKEKKNKELNMSVKTEMNNSATDMLHDTVPEKCKYSMEQCYIKQEVETLDADEQCEFGLKKEYERHIHTGYNHLHVKIQSHETAIKKEETVDRFADNVALGCSFSKATNIGIESIFIKEEQCESSLKNEYEGHVDIEYNSLCVGTQYGDGSTIKNEKNIDCIENRQALDSYSNEVTQFETVFIKDDEISVTKSFGKVKRYEKICPSEKPYSCEKCSYKCSQPSHLKQHKRIHTGDRPFACDMCNYKCITFSKLKLHKRKHTNEKPFSCDSCDYKCSLYGNLKKHKRMHTGERPFSCDICSYKCYNSSDLKRHKRSHTGEKPFSCDMCSFKCNASSHLKEHKRTHTGEKPFSCDMCEYKCVQLGNLKRHKKTHINQK